MNISYLLYQAERPRTAAQQRETDTQAGELAAAIARRGRSARRAVTRDHGTGRHGIGRAGRPTAPATVSCAVARPR